MGLTQVSEKGIKDGEILNADINASAAIAGSKIDPSFTGNITVSNTSPQIQLIDTDNNSDFQIKNNDGQFRIRDLTHSINRLTIASDGTVDVTGDMTIDTNTLHVDSSNDRVGINTTSPTSGSELDVNGKIKTGSIGIGTVPIDHQHIHIESADPRVLIRSTGTNAAKLMFGDQSNNDAGVIEYAHSNNMMSFSTGTVERMRIDSNGDVGIGTTNSQSRMHLKGESGVLSVDSYPQLTIETSATDGAANKGGGILFLNHDGTGGSFGGSIQSLKENATSGNNAHYMRFCTRPNGGSVTERMRVDSSGVVQLANKTITGGNNNAIQNIKCLGTWSGGGSIGKTIELISGYDSTVKMAAISYNLTDTSTGGTYGGDLNLHSQPLYSSPTTPIPIGLKVKSDGCVQLPKNPSFRADLNNSVNNSSLNSGARKLSYTLGHTLDQVRWDVGSNYTSSNSRFTCPVDGTYVFHLYMGGHSSSESQSYVGMEIYVNGSRYNGAWFNQGSGYSVAERTWTLKLSDGDYVEMGYELSNNNGWKVIASTGVTKRYTGFEGYLVG